MKIVLAASNFPPEFVGGTERVVMALAESLVHRGHEVVVVAGSEQLVDDAGAEPVVEPVVVGSVEIPVYRLHRTPTEPYGMDLSRPRVAALWRDILQQQRPDVVHTHAEAALSSRLLREARTVRAQGAPSMGIVATWHDLWATCPRFFRVRPDGGACPKGAAREACVACIRHDLGADPGTCAGMIARRDRDLRAELDAADVLTAPSRFAADALVAHMPLARPVEVVGHGVLDAAIRRAPARAGRSARPLRVGTFGNLVAEKGVDLLVEACARVCEAGAGVAPFELVLAGRFLDDRFAQRLEAQARAAGLSLVVTGPYRPEDRPHPAEQLDLAVFPSLCRETYGLVVDEALARGVPVVVSDRGAMPERVGHAGVVVGVESSEPLVAALVRLLADGGVALADLAAAVPPTWPSVDDAVERYLSLYRGPPR